MHFFATVVPLTKKARFLRKLCALTNAIRENVDISSSSEVFERMEKRIKIAETDVGAQLQKQVDDLKALLRAYRMGAVTEDHKS